MVSRRTWNFINILKKKKKKRQTKVGSLEILWKKNVQLVLKFPDLFIYFPSYFW